MGTMYTRKPFSSLRQSSLDPDEVLREVKSPSVPPPRSFLAEIGEQIAGRPFATLGAVFAVGALVGTLLGSRFARIASVVAIGSLLHARRDAFRRKEANAVTHAHPDAGAMTN